MITTSLDLLSVLLLTQRIVLYCCIFSWNVDKLLTPVCSPQGLFPKADPQAVYIEFPNVPVGLFLQSATISVTDRASSLILPSCSTLQLKENLMRNELCLHQILNKDFE